MKLALGLFVASTAFGGYVVNDLKSFSSGNAYAWGKPSENDSKGKSNKDKGEEYSFKSDRLFLEQKFVTKQADLKKFEHLFKLYKDWYKPPHDTVVPEPMLFSVLIPGFATMFYVARRRSPRKPTS